MPAAPKVFGIILAGGEGKRLMPLTADRAKPAVPFGGQYRLVDFALSNLLNSGLRQIVVLTQYKSHSLDRHVSQTWRMSGLLNSYVAAVPAQAFTAPIGSDKGSVTATDRPASVSPPAGEGIIAILIG